jgi:hypothetical protein
MFERHNSDAYADGASDPFGAETVDTVALSLFASYVRGWEPETVPDLYLGSLGFVSAQREFAKAGATRPKTVLSLGWHGTFKDPERTGFAVIRTESKHADLLGERVRVTTRVEGVQRSVLVYVHNEVEMDDDSIDLSLTRRAFMQVGFLSYEKLDGTVEVMA